MNTETDARRLVRPEDATRFVVDILVANGVPKDNAAIVARCLIQADLRGVDTHGQPVDSRPYTTDRPGANRVPSYMERIRQGVLDARATPVLSDVTPVVCQVDGRNGPSSHLLRRITDWSAFGFLSATMAMSRCVEMAQVYGIGMASVKHSNHFGMSASFVLQAADAGMMSLVFTNSSPAVRCTRP